jgi:hypothetical protein
MTTRNNRYWAAGPRRPPFQSREGTRHARVLRAVILAVLGFVLTDGLDGWPITRAIWRLFRRFGSAKTREPHIDV